MQPGSKAGHLLPYLFVPPTPRSNDNKVRAIAHQHPGVEKRVEVLAGLDGADEQDEALRQLQPRPRLRSFAGAHGPEFRRDPVGHHRDPAAIDAKDVDDVGRRVLRNGYHNIGAENRARHDDAGAKRLTRGEPARVAVDREVVNRDDRRASDAA